MDKVHEFEIDVRQKDGYLFEVQFDKPGHPVLLVDEPAPLSGDQAPNPSRLLAAAIGSCLSASLVFCAKRHAKLDLSDLRCKVHVDVVRNERRRQRIGKISVALESARGAEDPALAECRELFQDFCTVTESVRHGIDVDITLNGR